MAMKRTILSEKELHLIEALVVKYGIVVTFNQIRSTLKNKISIQGIRNLANKLTKNGWLVGIKKGTYAITSLESRGFTTLSVFKIAQTLEKDSYVSFEAALQHHGMFDQHLKRIVSVSLKRRAAKEIQGTRYQFVKTKKELFYGWQQQRVENYLVNIASAEKALLDILSFKRDIYSIDLVLEKLKEHKESLDFKRLNKFCEKQTMAAKRILGFLFDKLAIDSSHIHDLTKASKNCTYMTKDSKKFNARWRLYFHKHFNS